MILVLYMMSALLFQFRMDTRPMIDFFRHDGFLFKENKLCVPNCSICELLVSKAHEGGLMGHFGFAKTLDVLRKHFYWPNMKRDVQIICDRCITYRQAKSRVMPH